MPLTVEDGFIRFSQPDRVSIVKEYDGQVKTPEDRNREQDDDAHNEVDGEEAIKLYDELVKSLEDRLVLEKEIPSLIGRARQSDHGRKNGNNSRKKGPPKCQMPSEIGGPSASN